MALILALMLLGAAMLPAQDELVDLKSWRAKEGDDARWAAPGFDDSDWKNAAPLGSRTIGTRDVAPVTWYRVTYRIPPQWQGHSLALGIWKLDEAYEVFAGGVKIGTFGSLPPFGSMDDRAVTAFPFQRMAFRIPAEACHEGSVRIAVRRWRLPVTNNMELYEIATFPNVFPVIGLASLVERERELLVARRNVQGLPGILGWLVILACSGLCLAMRRQRDDDELLWAGVALLALAVYATTPVAMALLDLPKTSFVTFAWAFLSYAATTLFFGWLLAALLPEWRQWLRWASLAIALAISLWYVSASLWILPWDIAIALRQFGRIAQIAISLGCVWVVWRGRRPGLAVVLAVAVNALVMGVTGIWNPANYYNVGPFVFSLRRTSDALIAVAIATLLYARVRREGARQRELTRDFEAARRVQENLLGAADTTTSAFAVKAVYLPAREVGGDFYQTLPGEDGSLLVLVGDVSGKGLQAAMLVSSVIGSLRNEFSRSPGEVLAHLNRSLLGRTGGGFVTCCCARFDLDGLVTIANAGHLAPYAEGRELEIEAGLPLGVVADVTYTESNFRGAVFCFVSDGVVEAENEQRELFGFERTRELSLRTAQEMAEAAKAWGQNDDITVVTVRRNT